MKKIMFNDKYGLTKAVLEGSKTQTRRIDKEFNSFYGTLEYNRSVVKPYGVVELWNDKRNTYLEFKTRYKVGEKVAIAQNYKDAGLNDSYESAKGWNNKMFVKADLIPHHIEITDIRLERLQDISESDCIAEGIIEDIFNDGEFSGIGSDNYKGYYYGDRTFCRAFSSPREAYKSLIDNVGKKGDWESNPFVFVYEFKLVK